MADDREVLRILWDGRIPVCFTLNADEVFTLEQPEPFYVSFLALCNILEQVNCTIEEWPDVYCMTVCGNQF